MSVFSSEMMQVVNHLTVDRFAYRFVYAPSSDEAEDECSPVFVCSFNSEDVRRTEMEFEGFELTGLRIDAIELLHGKAQFGADPLESRSRGVASASDDESLPIDHESCSGLTQLERPGEQHLP